jgi:phage protein D/phage baseplate assembly protein gpV
VKPVLALPRVLLEIDGSRLDDDEVRELASLRVRQRLAAPAMCELAFHGDASVELPAPGSQLRVAIGGSDSPLFGGQITAVEHVFGSDREYGVLVRAYDPLHTLRKHQRARALVQTTVEELAGDLVGDLGLSVEAAEQGPVWQNLVQHRETDLELLVVLAARCGLYPVVHDDVLHLITLEGTGDAVPLAVGNQLIEARIELNGERSARSVSAAGWDPLRAETYHATAGSPRSGRDVEAEVPPGDVGGTGEVALFGEYASDEAHAAALAQAELDARSAGEVTFWGVAEGDPSLRAGTPVDVSGLRDELDGRYVLTEVTHTIDAARGFVSELSTAPPAVRTRRTAATAALGEVTTVDDPDGRGRVRVKFPAYGDVESDWLGTTVAGAGSNRGIVAMSDVGDHVLVVFPHEDPATGIVVGGLYGTGGPPDPGVASAAVKRFTMRTSGGQHIALDDEHQKLRLEDVTGSSIELGPKRVILHSAVDLTIEAPGRTILVRAKAVDFEQAS